MLWQLWTLIWQLVFSTGFLIAGVRIARGRELPVGLDGSPPSFTLRGRAAAVVGVVLASLGVAGIIHTLL